MSNPIFGKDKILKFRQLSKAADKEADKLALQIEHTISYDSNIDSQQTKDGAINYSGGLTTTIEITAVSTRDAINDMLRNSVINQEILEVWEIDIGAEPMDGKYPAKYGRGLLSSWEDPANVEDASQFSTTFNVDGILQDGFVELTEEEKSEIQYTFQDTNKLGETGPEESK